MSETSNGGRLRPLLAGVVLRSQTDDRLCGLAAAGNQQAFNAIFERYSRELSAHAARIVRPDRADDVVQQAMLRAWTALADGPRIAELRPWLHRVVHNAALDTVARRGYDDGELPLSSTAPTLTDELVERRLAVGAALTAMAALPENQLRALTLTAIDGRSGRDAALTMGISETAMRQLVHRARSRVRTAVSAITPLPLANWLTGTGASVTPAAAGLAGGGAATAAKVIAVIGVTATLGVTHTFGPGGGRSPHREAPTGQAATSNAAPRLEVQQVALAAPAGRIRPSTLKLSQAASHATGDPAASPSPSPSASPSGETAGDSRGDQSAHSSPSDPTPTADDQGLAIQTADQGGGPGGGVSQDAPAAIQAANDQAAGGRAEPQQGAGTPGDQSSGDRSPSPPNIRSDNVATGVTGDLATPQSAPQGD